jgi:predicted PurR-regulated permease PerM
MSKTLTMSYAMKIFTIVIVILFVVVNTQWYTELVSTTQHVQETFSTNNREDLNKIKKANEFHNISEQLSSINNTFSEILKTGLNIKTSELLNNVNKMNNIK